MAKKGTRNSCYAHGHLLNRSRTSTYRSWDNMIQRMTNFNHEKFKDYAGRGINLHEPWLKFENFFVDMGHRPEGMTLDRIDVNGDYKPSNCRWATIKQQNQNRRNSIKNRGVTNGQGK